MRADVILLVLALGGCVNNATFRSSAGTMAGYMAAHAAAMHETRNRYDALNADLERIVALQEQQADCSKAAIPHRHALGCLAIGRASS